MGRAYGVMHAADLAAWLPEGSRTLRCYDERGAWTSDRTLMAAMVNDLNWLVWAQSKDARHGRNKPSPIGPFDDPRERSYRGMAMTVEELNERLERARRGARG